MRSPTGARSASQGGGDSSRGGGGDRGSLAGSAVRSEWNCKILAFRLERYNVGMNATYLDLPALAADEALAATLEALAARES